MKILVIEDEERIASFLHKGLTAHGYAVDWASTGQDGHWVVLTARGTITSAR